MTNRTKPAITMPPSVAPTRYRVEYMIIGAKGPKLAVEIDTFKFNSTAQIGEVLSMLSKKLERDSLALKDIMVLSFSKLSPPHA